MQIQCPYKSDFHTYAAGRFPKNLLDVIHNISMNQMSRQKQRQNHNRQIQFHPLCFQAYEVPSTIPHCALYPPAPCNPTADQIVCGSTVISNNSLRQRIAVRAQFISSFQYNSCTRSLIWFLIMLFWSALILLSVMIAPLLSPFINSIFIKAFFAGGGQSFLKMTAIVAINLPAPPAPPTV